MIRHRLFDAAGSIIAELERDEPMPYAFEWWTNLGIRKMQYVGIEDGMRIYAEVLVWTLVGRHARN